MLRELGRQGIDLRAVARLHRLMLKIALSALLLQVWACSASIVQVLQMGLVVLAVQAVLAFVTLRLLALQQTPLLWRIAWVMFVFCPGLTFPAVVGIDSRTGHFLRRWQLRPGLFGVPDSAVVWLLDRPRCIACGYDLTGNLSRQCPECGAATEVAVQTPE